MVGKSAFPRPRSAIGAATPDQLNNIEIICNGTGLHWPDLDEDLSVVGILEDGWVHRKTSLATECEGSEMRLAPQLLHVPASSSGHGGTPRRGGSLLPVGRRRRRGLAAGPSLVIRWIDCFSPPRKRRVKSHNSTMHQSPSQKAEGEVRFQSQTGAEPPECQES